MALRGGVDPQPSKYLPKEGGRKTPGTVRAEWGRTLDSLQAEMGDPPHWPARKKTGIKELDKREPDSKALTCWAENGTTCYPSIAAPWYVDFGGQSADWQASPLMTFAPDGRFFRYRTDLPDFLFERVRDALLARLGQPTLDEHSEVHNALGATFDQEKVVWQRAHTMVKLTKRAVNDLGTTVLFAEYLPIAETVPGAPDDVRAPM